mmetsp:Transcript_18917/g.36336  ORF Transcript_18917/g.36336 Transcript_18917/m.36336 type:complete len:377 (+) Transcript_18917:3002-4132(+)
MPIVFQGLHVHIRHRCHLTIAPGRTRVAGFGIQAIVEPQVRLEEAVFIGEESLFADALPGLRDVATPFGVLCTRHTASAVLASHQIVLGAALDATHGPLLRRIPSMGRGRARGALRRGFTRELSGWAVQTRVPVLIRASRTRLAASVDRDGPPHAAVDSQGRVLSDELLGLVRAGVQEAGPASPGVEREFLSRRRRKDGVHGIGTLDPEAAVACPGRERAVREVRGDVHLHPVVGVGRDGEGDVLPDELVVAIGDVDVDGSVEPHPGERAGCLASPQEILRGASEVIALLRNIALVGEREQILAPLLLLLVCQERLHKRVVALLVQVDRASCALLRTVLREPCLRDEVARGVLVHHVQGSALGVHRVQIRIVFARW